MQKTSNQEYQLCNFFFSFHFIRLFLKISSVFRVCLRCEYFRELVASEKKEDNISVDLDPCLYDLLTLYLLLCRHSVDLCVFRLPFSRLFLQRAERRSCMQFGNAIAGSLHQGTSDYLSIIIKQPLCQIFKSSKKQIKYYEDTIALQCIRNYGRCGLTRTQNKNPDAITI